MIRKYTDEFKLSVVQDYYHSTLGVRAIAAKYNLPSKYEAILIIEFQFPILLLCEISGISKSAYYRYKKKPLKPISTIEDKVFDIYNKSGKHAGYRTIRDILRHK